MHQDILPNVIFSPGTLALDLARALHEQSVSVTLFTPGPVDTPVRNITADLSYLQQELDNRGDTYMELLKKHPFTFITLARQVQTELLSDAIARANNEEFDIVHVYTNEEEVALPLAKLCTKPVVFTHHDPFNFLIKYKSVFPKYRHLNWLSISDAQRRGMPTDTNWIKTIYHGLDPSLYTLQRDESSSERYVAYLGRIIESKGVYDAIDAVQTYNTQHPEKPLTLKIAGKHYSGKKDAYWEEKIEPALADPCIEYVGFIANTKDKQAFLGNAKGLIIPSSFEEPFGMVMIEAMACGTPIIGTPSGAIPEIVRPQSGIVAPKESLADALSELDNVDRRMVRQEFEARFTLQRMAQEHIAAYQQLIK